ncbi:hypothetical protein GGQ92_002651 [Gracilibacillus halotolerans]|uniref:DUF5673 domain-containing protein n=1 Tax=Gracilibacillus halotolerans TaxID=74386 RepID=A0A841RPP1_9BACI|nr:hypothetical protein [Gracilibacillus halotolerans]MBB6513832.1 hypothetical protein [Gracilibacillus halotolerans]
METALFIIIILFVIYIIYRFIVLLTKMRQPILYPTTDQEWSSTHVYPQKKIRPPRPSYQKGGVLLYACTIIYFTVVLVLWFYFETISWPLLLLAIVPYLQMHTVFNMFAVVQDGMLCGGRFIRWKFIKSYEWYPINTNHRFYGFGEEVNNGYELKLKTKFIALPASLIVTDTSVKQNLTKTLNQYVE